jgi:signal transduction histidine kinase
MNSSAVDAAQNQPTAAPEGRHRSPLAQLVHALNQPLTGLQCAMEVALARPRTVEQHVLGLRESLALTERMRGLVEAIREVAEMEEADIASREGQTRGWETGELENVLREAAEDLRPVAAEKNVRIALDFSAAPAAFPQSITRPHSSSRQSLSGQSSFAPVIFRLLDSALSLAESGTVVQMQGRMEKEIWFRVQWQAAAPRSESSRPELGLLTAQAWLERCGAEWQREQNGDLTVLTVAWRASLPSQPAGNPQ